MITTISFLGDMKTEIDSIVGHIRGSSGLILVYFWFYPDIFTFYLQIPKNFISFSFDL